MAINLIAKMSVYKTHTNTLIGYSLAANGAFKYMALENARMLVISHGFCNIGCSNACSELVCLLAGEVPLHLKSPTGGYSHYHICHAPYKFQI